MCPWEDALKHATLSHKHPFVTLLLQMDLDLSTPQLAALSVLALYFTLIIGLFVLIVRSLKQLSGARKDADLGAWPYLFSGLALGSFLHTWYCE